MRVVKASFPVELTEYAKGQNIDHEPAKSFDEAFALDEQNGNKWWRDSIEKEIGKARVVFQRKDGFIPDDIR